MKLIFIYGLPATGKLTVAKELASMTGFKLFHNHLAVDLLLSVFDFGTPPFVKLREEIWLSVITEACRSNLSGLIFTFAPESTVRPEFIPQAIRAVTSLGGEIEFVELTCPLADLKARIENPSRLQHQKLASIAEFEQLHAQGVFASPPMPQPSLTIDTSLNTPTQSATRIATRIAQLAAAQPLHQ